MMKPHTRADMQMWLLKALQIVEKGKRNTLECKQLYLLRL